MRDFKPFPIPSQCYQDVLFFNAGATSDRLFDIAQQRMCAVLDLLQVIEQSDYSGPLPGEVARLSGAIGLLLGDARTLYEAAHERAMAEG